MLHLLHEAGWKPDDTVERRAFAELLRLIQASRAVLLHAWVPADPTRLSGVKGNVRGLMVTPDGTRLCVSTDQEIRLWALPSGKAQRTIPGEKATGWHVAVTPDSKLLVTDFTVYRPWPQRPPPGGPEVASLWELPSGKPAGVLTGPVDGVNEMLVTPDGRLLVVGDRTGAIHLWVLASSRSAVTLTGINSPVSCLAASPSGELVASGHGDGTILLWPLTDDDFRLRMDWRKTVGGLLGGLSPGEGVVRMEPLPTPLDLGGSVGKVLVLGTGQVTAIGPGGGLLKLWELEGRRARRNPKAIGWVSGQAVATPDGTLLAAGGLEGVQTWRLPEGTPDRILRTEGSGVTKLRVLANGDLLAGFANFGHGVHLWRLPSGQPDGTLTDDGRKGIEHLSATPDGDTIVTADSDHVVTLWRLWDRRLRALSHLALTDIEPDSIQQAQSPSAQSLPSESRWLDLIAALVRWRDDPRVATRDDRWDLLDVTRNPTTSDTREDTPTASPTSRRSNRRHRPGRSVVPARELGSPARRPGLGAPLAALLRRVAARVWPTDDVKHAEELRSLINRVDSGAIRIIDAAERLFGELNQADDREDDKYADVYRVGAVTKWRWRRLENLHRYAYALLDSVSTWSAVASDIYAEQPTGSWRRWRQRRRLLSVAKYFERAATHLEGVHP